MIAKMIVPWFCEWFCKTKTQTNEFNIGLCIKYNIAANSNTTISKAFSMDQTNDTSMQTSNYKWQITNTRKQQNTNANNIHAQFNNN